LSDFYKIRRGEGVPASQVRTLAPKFYHRGLEMWAEVRQNRQNMDFCYKCAPNGPIPLSVFLSNLVQERSKSAPSPQSHHCGFSNVGLQDQKSPKLIIFAINLPQRAYPLKRFLQNLVWGASPGLQGPRFYAKFHRGKILIT